MIWSTNSKEASERPPGHFFYNYLIDNLTVSM